MERETVEQKPFYFSPACPSHFELPPFESEISNFIQIKPGFLVFKRLLVFGDLTVGDGFSRSTSKLWQIQCPIRADTN